MRPKAQRQAHAADTSPSLREQAYLEIKRRINRLEYRPGAYLNEALISRQLKIGRTPVHQALDRLMLEGLVQVIPRKGVVVQTRRGLSTSPIAQALLPSAPAGTISHGCRS
jgi:DNA-binding GntR family transcriptional regulator